MASGVQSKSYQCYCKLVEVNSLYIAKNSLVVVVGAVALTAIAAAVNILLEQFYLVFIPSVVITSPGGIFLVKVAVIGGGIAACVSIPIFLISLIANRCLAARNPGENNEPEPRHIRCFWE